MTAQEHKQEYEKRQKTYPDIKAQLMAQALHAMNEEERTECTMDAFVAMIFHRIYKAEMPDFDDVEDIMEKSYAIYSDVESWAERYTTTAKTFI